MSITDSELAPLCGTLNYAVTTPLVPVDVALRSGGPGGPVIAAASVDPLAGEAFWTDVSGAWRRRDGVDTPLAPSADSFLVEVNLDPPFPAFSVHFAAGIALCLAAGCVVTGIRGGSLDTGAGGLLAAADHETHQALLAIVKNG